MRGRKPKPTAIKVLAGNPGKRPLNAAEPRPPVPAGTPYVPRFLNEEGKREWRRIVRVLVELGLYTEVDRAALAMYCQAWGLWVRAERMVRKEGEILTSEKGFSYQNPRRYAANKAFDQLRRMLSEFGLTPSARSRLQVAPPQEEESLAEMLFRAVQGE